VQLFRPESLGQRLIGIQVGTVVDNKDPEGLYRVQVRFVRPSGDVQSAWARVRTLMAGKEMGFACLPEKEDEVLLRFVNGNPDLPVVVGGVHNGKSKPPFDNADGNNDERIFYSRSGHHLVANDKNGGEHITVESKGGKTKVELLSKDKAIKLTASKDIVLKVGGTLKVEAGADMELKASASCKQMASSKLELKSDGKVDVKGSAGVSLKGPKLDFSA
tara:strand:+ start:48 stop:701 length:654 start_codon:yes stop_codon:yes gene_type:complete